MSTDRNLTVFCIASYEKGQEFLRECKRLGCRVLLLTVEKLRNADWPREALDDIFFVPENLSLDGKISAVSYLARSQKIDRIVALDEFDMETASALREHLRIPGMGLTTMRYFRDKLAMRAQAHEKGIAVPDFVPVLNYEDMRKYMGRVRPPWLLKPRSEASAIGIKKVHSPEQLWPLLDSLADKQSYFLLEKFVPGDIYHVDGIVSERDVVFADVHAYGNPPMKVAHEGGVFTTRTLPRDSHEAIHLREINTRLIRALGLVRGVTHAEFIRAKEDGRFYFMEAAARVGGAYINEMVEAATGINLWREWARIEVAGGKQPYQLPEITQNYAGVVLCLARQESPDTSSYSDPEIVLRIKKRHHAGLVLKSSNPGRVKALLDSYSERFRVDFLATQPLPEKATA